MAKKGYKKKQKRISATKVTKILRKENKFTIAALPGAHKKIISVPLGIIIRDYLGLTKNLRNTKHILAKRKILVNQKIRTSHKLPVGLFDVVSIPSEEKNYKVVFDRKGRLVMEETKNTKEKISKIVNRKIVKGNNLIAITNDGLQIQDKNKKIKVGDSIKISIPEGKLLAHYPLQKGSLVYIIAGKHAGEQEKILEMKEGSMTKPGLVLLEKKDNKFETITKNIMVLGEKL